MAFEIALVGFGEAGQAMARGWALPPGRVTAFDVKISNAHLLGPLQQAANTYSVDLAADISTAMAQANLVFALVPTDQTIAAAEAAAPNINAGTVWFDGSSSSPGRKREAASIVSSAGAHYVDAAIMAPVFPLLHRTPLLLAGPTAEQARQMLDELNMVAEVVGSEIGHASAIKMIRSVLVKGVEAVTAECLLAARKAGVEQEVLASLEKSDPEVDWGARTSYNLERMARHGARRAAELREVVSTLEELNVPARMSTASALWQDQIADLELEITNEPLFVRLDAALNALL